MKSRLWGGLGLLLFGAGWLFPYLPGFSLWFDEVAVVEGALTSTTFRDYYLPQEPALIVHPPLFFVMLRGWTLAVGQSDVALRSLTMLLALVATALIFRLSLDLTHQLRVALSSGVIFITLGFIEQYAQTTHNYIFFLLVSLLYLLCHERYWLQRNSAYGLGIILTTAALFYTHYYAVFLIAGANCYVLLQWRDPQWRDWVKTQLIALLLFGPWLFVLVGLANSGYQTTEQAGVVANSQSSNWEGIENIYRILFYDGEILYALGILGGAGLWLRRQRPSAHWLLVILLSSLGLVLAANLIEPTFNARRIIYVIGGATLCIGYGVGQLPRQVVGVGLLAIILLTPNNPKPVPVGADWQYRQGIAWIENQPEVSDFVYVHFHGTLITRPLHYYLEQTALRHHLQEQDVARLHAYTWARERWWLIWNPQATTFETVVAPLENDVKTYREVERRDFPEFSVSLVEAGHPPPPTLTPVRQTFGGMVRLQGVALSQTEFCAGETVTFSLEWELLRPTSEDYSIFVHLLTPDLGTLAAPPFDAVPTHLGKPTSTSVWGVGQPIWDEHHLLLPDDLARGRYVLRIGMYGQQNPTRLVVDEIGQDGWILGEIEVNCP